jgi:hypothetical protein
MQEERFWSKVRRHPTDCWEWQGYRMNKGYGSVHVKPGRGGKVLAHRLAYEFANGPVGDFYVLHKCDNPACVRPSHLFLGNQQDNIRDMHAKGRGGDVGPDPKPFCPRGHARSMMASGRWTCYECNRARDRARRPPGTFARVA